MLCPACQTPLETIATEGHYGTYLDAHACQGCGGYWFDGGKATALGFQGALTLDGAADLNAVARAPHGDARRCPRCKQPMREIRGGPLPEGLHLDQCGPCRGMWFDMGELLLYKSEIEGRRRGKPGIRLCAYRATGIPRRPNRHPPLRLRRNRLPPHQ